MSNFEIYGPFSANSSSHTFLLEFLQFIVTLVGTVVNSTGFIDTVVKVEYGCGIVTRDRPHVQFNAHGKYLHGYSITKSVFTLSILKFRTGIMCIH